MLQDKDSQLSGENVCSSAHLQDALVRDNDKDKVSAPSPADMRPMSELRFTARRPSHSAAVIDHDEQDYLNLNEMSSDELSKWPQAPVQQSLNPPPPPPPPSSEQYINLNAFPVAQPDPKLLSRQPSTPAVHENETVHLLRQSLQRQHPSSLSPASTSTSTASSTLASTSTSTSTRLVAQANGAVAYSESEQLATSPPAQTGGRQSNKRRSDAKRVPTEQRRPANSTRQALPSQSNANANESHVTYTELAEMAPRSAERTPKQSLVTSVGSAPQPQPQPQPLQQQSSRRESRSQSSQAKSHVPQEMSLPSPQQYSYQQPSPSEKHVAQQAAPAVSSSSSPPPAPAATAPNASQAQAQDAVEYTPISADKTQALMVVARQRNERMQQQRRPPGQLARAGAAPDAPASGVSGSKTQLDRKAAANNKSSAAKSATGARGNSDAASIGVPAARPVHNNGVPLRGGLSLIGGIFRSARNSQSCE